MDYRERIMELNDDQLEKLIGIFLFKLDASIKNGEINKVYEYGILDDIMEEGVIDEEFAAKISELESLVIKEGAMRFCMFKDLNNLYRTHMDSLAKLILNV